MQNISRVSIYSKAYKIKKNNEAIGERMLDFTDKSLSL
jgi:hypothetical protein